MNILTIDLADMENAQEFHGKIKELFGLQVYGNNLDALHDVLTSVSNVKLEVTGMEEANDEVRTFWDRAGRVMEDSHNENPSFTYELIWEPDSEEE